MKSFYLYLFKLLPFLSLGSLPLITFYSLGRDTSFNLETLKEKKTRVHLYIEGLKLVSNQESTATSINSKNSFRQASQQIFQVSSENTKKGNTPSLVFELNLENLDKEQNHKYCIPEKSVLNNQIDLSVNSQTGENLTPKCELRSVETSAVDKRLDMEIIKYLLKNIISFLKVEHVHSMLMFYDKKIQFKNINGKDFPQKENNDNVTKKIQELKDSCNVFENNSKSILEDLFLSSAYKKQDCLFSPVLMEIKLKVKEICTNGKSQNFKISKEILSKGFLQGRISYALFDYLTGMKEINKSDNNKKTVFTFKSGNKYFLNDFFKQDLCSLEKMNDLVNSKDLRIEDFFKRFGQKSLCKENWDKKK